MIVPLSNSLNILNLVCLVATEILLIRKLKGDFSFWIFSPFWWFFFFCIWVRMVCSRLSCVGLVGWSEGGKLTFSQCFAAIVNLKSKTNTKPLGTLMYLVLLLLAVASPFLPFLLSCFLMPEQTTSSERRGEWEIQPSRQTNTSYLTSHLAADRHGGSVQVLTAFIAFSWPSEHGWENVGLLLKFRVF